MRTEMGTSVRRWRRGLQGTTRPRGGGGVNRCGRFRQKKEETKRLLSKKDTTGIPRLVSRSHADGTSLPPPRSAPRPSTAGSRSSSSSSSSFSASLLLLLLRLLCLPPPPPPPSPGRPPCDSFAAETPSSSCPRTFDPPPLRASQPRARSGSDSRGPSLKLDGGRAEAGQEGESVLT
eukprot:762474-Hanusia_phi.AAC.1